MSSPRSIRLAICATHPIQYQVPLWRALAARPDIVVKVFYGTDMSVRGYKDEGFGVSFKWDTPLLGGYQHHFLSTDPNVQRATFWQPKADGIVDAIRDFQPHVVLLTAYNSIFHVGAWRAARKCGAKIVMRHEASDVAHARSAWKNVLRDAILRLVYSQVDQFAAIGIEARRHLKRLGVSDPRLGNSPYCVDSDFVAKQIEVWKPQREAIRSELGVTGENDPIALVFSGKLIPKKDPLLVIEALEYLKAPRRGSIAERIHLIVAGDGELRNELEQRGRAVLGSRLHLLGFLNQTQIGKAYAAGDALVMPSRRGAGETWGLVVNEAMQFGMPVIVSDGVGSNPDLVRQGETGFVFQNRDATSLAAALDRFGKLSPVQRTKMSFAANNHIKAYSLGMAADGLIDSIKKTLQTS